VTLYSDLDGVLGEFRILDLLPSSVDETGYDPWVVRCSSKSSEHGAGHPETYTILLFFYPKSLIFGQRIPIDPTRRDRYTIFIYIYIYIYIYFVCELSGACYYDLGTAIHIPMSGSSGY
jgi:hypothetical protein